MIRIRSGLSVLILTLFSSLVHANNDKGFLEYKKEEANQNVVVKQEINAELEMRLRKLEEQNKRLTDLLTENQQKKVVVETPKEENIKEEKIIEEKNTTITLQEKARLDAFDYNNFIVSGEAANYYILKDSQNRRKIIYKNEVEIFNSKVKMENKLASDKNSKLREE